MVWVCFLWRETRWWRPKFKILKFQAPFGHIVTSQTPGNIPKWPKMQHCCWLNLSKTYSLVLLCYLMGSCVVLCGPLGVRGRTPYTCQLFSATISFLKSYHMSESPHAEVGQINKKKRISRWMIFLKFAIIGIHPPIGHDFFFQTLWLGKL